MALLYAFLGYVGLGFIVSGAVHLAEYFGYRSANPYQWAYSICFVIVLWPFTVLEILGVNFRGRNHQ